MSAYSWGTLATNALLLQLIFLCVNLATFGWNCLLLGGLIFSGLELGPHEPKNWHSEIYFTQSPAIR